MEEANGSSQSAAARLASLGLELPEGNPPQGNYLLFVQSGALVFVAGRGPRKRGRLIYKGVIGGPRGWPGSGPPLRIVYTGAVALRLQR